MSECVLVYFLIGFYSFSLSCLNYKSSLSICVLWKNVKFSELWTLSDTCSNTPARYKETMGNISIHFFIWYAKWQKKMNSWCDDSAVLFLSTYTEDKKDRKTTAREECEPRSHAEPKLKREMDEQLHQHNGRFRIHRVVTRTEPQTQKKRGAAITTAEAKKGHTHHTKNSSLVTCQDDPGLTRL